MRQRVMAFLKPFARTHLFSALARDWGEVVLETAASPVESATPTTPSVHLDEDGQRLVRVRAFDRALHGQSEQLRPHVAIDEADQSVSPAPHPVWPIWRRRRGGGGCMSSGPS